MKNENFADYNYKGEERFFPMENGDVVWIYFNPDAVSGAQWVENIITEDLMQEALNMYSLMDLEKEEYVDEVFHYIECECREYLIDWWDEDFESYVEAMEKPKGNFVEGATSKTLEWLINYFSCMVDII